MLPSSGRQPINTDRAASERRRFLTAVAGSDVAANLRRWQTGASRGNPLVEHHGSSDNPATWHPPAPRKRIDRLREHDARIAAEHIRRNNGAAMPSCSETRQLIAP